MALVILIQLVGVGGIEHGSFAAVKPSQNVVDVAVGQIALVQIMLGIVAVQVIAGRQEISRGIAPCALALDGGDLILNGIHQIVDIVVRTQIFVAVVCNQFNGQVAGNTAHALKAAVHGHITVQVLVQKILCQTAGKAHVFVQMQRQTNTGGNVVVSQADNTV